MDDKFYQWIVKRPNLVIEPQLTVNPDTLAAQQSLPDVIPHKRLGFYYQDVVKAMINHSEHYRVVADELQVEHQGSTLGAIDYIVEERSNNTPVLQHWEIAIKFYLLHHGQWFGPNARDRLDLKLDKMLQKQLKLTHHAAFIEQYPKYCQLPSQLLLQGRLYTNPFVDEPIPHSCSGLTLEPSTIDGHWCYFNQLDLIGKPLYRVGKPQWATGEHHGQLFEATEGKLNRAAHCVDEDGQFWFIVPNEWPNN